MSRDNGWPELVGMHWEEAADKIRQEFPNMMIQAVPEGSMVTFDYNENRVRLFIDEDSKVVTTPIIG